MNEKQEQWLEDLGARFLTVTNISQEGHRFLEKQPMLFWGDVESEDACIELMNKALKDTTLSIRKIGREWFKGGPRSGGFAFFAVYREDMVQCLGFLQDFGIEFSGMNTAEEAFEAWVVIRKEKLFRRIFDAIMDNPTLLEQFGEISESEFLHQVEGMEMDELLYTCHRFGLEVCLTGP